MKKIYSLDETPYPFENISSIKAFSNKDKKMIEADKIKVVYQGNLGEQRKILQLIEILSRNFKQIEFHIVGFGEELEAIKSLENKRKNLITYGKLSNSEVAKILEKMHVGLISYSWNDLNNKYCASNKLYDYLFSGLIIFSSSQKTLKNLISRNKLGVCFDKDFSEEKLCRDFSFLLDNFADIQNNLKEYNKKHNPVNLSKIQEKNLLREVNERIRYQL
jgi:glycosyltransferase involved in cell wall biosynthesis